MMASRAPGGVVSTYPPTRCGLASFSAALVGAMAGAGGTSQGIGVVRLVDVVGTPRYPVVFEHRRGDDASLCAAVEVLNTFSTVSVQHEFGIFGGEDGDEVLELVSRVRVPMIITLHTVLDEPSARQREIVEHLARSSRAVVVMSAAASERLSRHYDVEASGIRVIPHGVDAVFRGPWVPSGDRPLAITWGLIGPGKGLEVAIDAFSHLRHLEPTPRYLVVGQTHPNVRRHSGESYRRELKARVRRLGLEHVVEFDDSYEDTATLAQLVRSADVVVLPYLSTTQVTSGVLAEAATAGRPIVATAFPHAVEVLSGGTGALVPHGDARALATALETVLTDADVAARMAARARRVSRGWSWPTVARQYRRLLDGVPARHPAVPGLLPDGREHDRAS